MKLAGQFRWGLMFAKEEEQKVFFIPFAVQSRGTGMRMPIPENVQFSPALTINIKAGDFPFSVDLDQKITRLEADSTDAREIMLMMLEGLRK